MLFWGNAEIKLEFKKTDSDSKHNLHRATEKSSCFSSFFGKPMIKNKVVFTTPLRWGRLCRLGELACEFDSFLDREARMAEF